MGLLKIIISKVFETCASRLVDLWLTLLNGLGFFFKKFKLFWKYSISIPLKTTENHWFSDVFSGNRKRPVALNRLSDLMAENLQCLKHPQNMVFETLN